MPIAIVVIGLFYAWLAWSRKTPWMGRGGWLMTAGGCVLLITTLVHHVSVVALYLAAALLIVATICFVISVVKRELRLSLE